MPACSPKVAQYHYLLTHGQRLTRGSRLLDGQYVKELRSPVIGIGTEGVFGVELNP